MIIILIIIVAQLIFIKELVDLANVVLQYQLSVVNTKVEQRRGRDILGRGTI